MAQLDPNECAVLLQFVRSSDINLKGELIPVVASAMHKMEATIIAAKKAQEAKEAEKEPKNTKRKDGNRTETPFG
jgi:hypothetical protein